MKYTEKFLQQRKLLVMLPVLVTPFLTLLFWCLGGGQGVTVAAPIDVQGINMKLPEAYFSSSETFDKFALYEKAYEDSMKVEDARETESYFNVDFIQDGDKDGLDTAIVGNNKKSSGILPATEGSVIDPNEKKVNDKLKELYKVLNGPVVVDSPPSVKSQPTAVIPEAQDSTFTRDVDKLEMLMKSMSRGSEEDPEMKQMNSMLDKILEIQHPERSRPASQPTNTAVTYEAVPAEGEDDTSILSGNPVALQLPDSVATPEDFQLDIFRSNGFYSDEETSDITTVGGDALQAVIHQDQEVVAGSTVKLRLTSAITINRSSIPAGSFVYGICSLNEERLSINITSLRSGNSLLPVTLQVYDMDGLPGIYIPGAITRDAAKQASTQSLQGLQLMSMDNSLGMQAATAGVESAKGLFTKKAKLVKVKLKAGYQILLMDANQNNKK